ncbi:DMT family transporter [Kiloniella sp. b19]|uniref:DMT family transporter n=1 Tax=Kiloniella sp. GXU_MW_B19 TaxID=3141326 RepID=UPI0031DBFFBF
MSTSSSSSRKDHLDGLAILVLMVCCFSWGFQQITIKWAVADISPIMQAGLRSAFATLVIAGWMLLRRKPIFGRDGTLKAGLLAGALFALEFALLYASLELTSASRAVIFLYTSPLFVALGAHFLIAGERLRLLQGLGLLCAFAGLAVTFGESLTLPDERMLIGDALAIAAAIAWAATTLVVRGSTLTTISASKVLLYQLAVSAVVLFPLSAAFGEPGIIRITESAVLILIYQAVGVAGISYIIWFWMLKTYPTAKLTSFGFLTPLFGVISGALILDEPLTPALLSGLVLVACGIWLVNKKTRAERAQLKAQKAREGSGAS